MTVLRRLYRWLVRVARVEDTYRRHHAESETPTSQSLKGKDQ